MRDQFALFHHQPLFVDIGAGADPANDLTFGAADRQSAAQGPAILAAMMPQPIFDLIGLAGFQAVAPPAPSRFLIVRVEHAVPGGTVRRPDRNAGIFIPARVVIIVIAVRERRPDHLRHGVRERPEHAVAVGNGGGVQTLLGDHVAIASAPLQFHHHLTRQQFQPFALKRRQIRPRRCVNDAQGAQRFAVTTDQRRAGVEADMRVAGDERIVRKSRVSGCVGHYEDLRAQHGMRAKGHIA